MFINMILITIHILICYEKFIKSYIDDNLYKS